LAVKEKPVLICSEAEYKEGVTPTLPARLARLKAAGLSFRYLPGLMIGRHSPRQLGLQAKRCLAAADGYWLFTTYSLWQEEPQKLWGPYLIKAPRDQYWQALARANRGELSAGPSRDYLCPDHVLVTNNSHYPGPKIRLPLEISYSSAPDVPFYTDPGRTKLFDGVERDSFGTAAWSAKADRELVIVVDLSRLVEVERLRLVAAHNLSNHPSVTRGSVTMLTSIDGKMYYPTAKETLLAGRGKNTPKMDYGELGIRARFIKIALKAEEVSKHSVWAVSELAVWGTL